jgi:3-polyprenyl-4-hydroxybenzoate decarboxylase
MPQNAIVGEGEAACMCRQRSSHRRDQLSQVEAHAVLSQRAEQTIAVVQARVDLSWDDGLNNDEMMYLMGLKAGSAAVAVGVAAMIIAPC